MKQLAHEPGAWSPVRALSADVEGGARLPGDRELVERALGGSEWAEEALYRKHVTAVTRTVRRLLARSLEAEDVVQDTFVAALGDLGKLRDRDAFGGWILQIAVRQVHRRFRRRRLLRLLGLDREEDDAALAALADEHASGEVCAELGKIDRLLARMPAAERVAWVLRYVEGYRLEEVAAACSCSLATAKRRITRAEAVIQEHVSFGSVEGLP